MRDARRIPPLYAIVDAGLAASAGWSVSALARAFLDGGARLIQVRAKRAGSAAFLEMCEAVVEAARRFEATVIVNDRADVAALAGADGVHLGQDDLTVAAVRTAFPGLAVVGVSTHTSGQIDAAAGTSPDYVAIGPVFATRTKETGYEAVGLDLVRYGTRVAGTPAFGWATPIIAIGGITLERARSVLDAGATSVAVIADLLTGGDPAARVREYVRLLGD